MKKPIWKKWWFWVIVLFIIGVISSGGDEEQKTNEVQNDEVVSNEDKNIESDKVEEVVAIEDVEKTKNTDINQLVYEAITTVGEETNMGLDRVVDLQINDNAGTAEEGDKIVFARLNADENLTSNMTRLSILMDTKKIFEKLFTVEGASQATLRWQLPLVDQYGNEKQGEVLRVEINKEIADKINWENFDYKNFPNISLDYFEHPAFNN